MAAKRANEIVARVSSSVTEMDEEQILEASDDAITLAQHIVAGDYARDHPWDIKAENQKIGTIFGKLFKLFTGR